MPGTLMLTDCLEACQANESCGAVNYETGLCVLFSANADKLPGKLTMIRRYLCIFREGEEGGVENCSEPWILSILATYGLHRVQVIGLIK